MKSHTLTFATVFPGLFKSKIPSATVYFAFCMLQFSVIASFPGPVQQMTEIWVGLGTWLGLQEDKVGLCNLQHCGTAKVLYRPVNSSSRGRFHESMQ